MKRNDPAVILITAAIVLIAIGIYMKQPGAVMRKAVRICMECIGLG